MACLIRFLSPETTAVLAMFIMYESGSSANEVRPFALLIGDEYWPTWFE